MSEGPRNAYMERMAAISQARAFAADALMRSHIAERRGALAEATAAALVAQTMCEDLAALYEWWLDEPLLGAMGTDDGVGSTSLGS